jgi:hypothetical protein
LHNVRGRRSYPIRDIFLEIASNCYNVRPVNDLKSNGLLDSLSYESDERIINRSELEHIAVYFNHTLDLFNKASIIDF